LKNPCATALLEILNNLSEYSLIVLESFIFIALGSLRHVAPSTTWYSLINFHCSWVCKACRISAKVILDSTFVFSNEALDTFIPLWHYYQNLLSNPGIYKIPVQQPILLTILNLSKYSLIVSESFIFIALGYARYVTPSTTWSSLINLHCCWVLKACNTFSKVILDISFVLSNEALDVLYFLTLLPKFS